MLKNTNIETDLRLLTSSTVQNMFHKVDFPCSLKNKFLLLEKKKEWTILPEKLTKVKIFGT